MRHAAVYRTFTPLARRLNCSLLSWSRGFSYYSFPTAMVAMEHHSALHYPAAVSFASAFPPCLDCSAKMPVLLLVSVLLLVLGWIGGYAHHAGRLRCWPRKRRVRLGTMAARRRCYG
ncbi:hypothetical protein ACQJBY_059294 [Aegilops geniculata]